MPRIEILNDGSFRKIKTSLELSIEQKMRDNYNDLSNQIDIEETDRIAEDETIRQEIQQVIIDNQNQYDQLQANIDTEAETRSNADSILQDNINTETENRISADNNLQDSIDIETTKRINTDSSLQNQIDTINSDLSSETQNRKSADNNLQNQIDQEITDRQNAASDLQQQIDSLSDEVNSDNQAIKDKVFYLTAVEEAGYLSTSEYELQTSFNVVQNKEYITIKNNDGSVALDSDGNKITVTNISNKLITFSAVPNQDIVIEFAYSKSFWNMQADALITTDIVASRIDADMAEIIGVNYFDGTKTVTSNGSLDSRIEDVISEHNSDISDLQQQINNLSTSHSSDITDLQQQIDTLESSFSVEGHTHPGSDIISTVEEANYASNSDKLDGYHSSHFAIAGHTHPGNNITSTVDNADKLDGHHADYFATSTHNHDAKYINTSGDKINGTFTLGNGALLNKTKSDDTTDTIIDNQGRVWNAVYNDLAEMFICFDDYASPGDVMMIEDGEVIRAYGNHSQKVVGVYSDTFAHCFGGQPENIGKIPIGIAGRVKVRVIGDIKEGDLLVTSNTPGVGKKAESYVPGTVFGKALENINTNTPKRIWALITNI